MRKYSDEQLTRAVEQSQSWRAVLRALGLSGTSAGSKRSVQRHADRLGLDYSHFTGQRRWSDRALASAVADSYNWSDVARSLGLAPGRSTTTIRGHALRLGLDTQHLDLKRPVEAPLRPTFPQRSKLARAGSLLAAAWFELAGDQVCWPLEPCRYDLIVWREGGAERIQVKTTTHKVGDSWQVGLSCTASKGGPYDPDEVDRFFVIDGDLGCYLIPIKAVGGRVAIQLSAYETYRLPPFVLVHA